MDRSGTGRKVSCSHSGGGCICLHFGVASVTRRDPARSRVSNGQFCASFVVSGDSDDWRVDVLSVDWVVGGRLAPGLTLVATSLPTPAGLGSRSAVRNAWLH